MLSNAPVFGGSVLSIMYLFPERNVKERNATWKKLSWGRGQTAPLNAAP
jgi:hypothetical protein